MRILKTPLPPWTLSITYSIGIFTFARACPLTCIISQPWRDYKYSNIWTVDLHMHLTAGNWYRTQERPQNMSACEIMSPRAWMGHHLFAECSGPRAWFITKCPCLKMPVYLQLTIRIWTITLYTYNFNNRRASSSYPTGTRGLRCQISGCLHWPGEDPDAVRSWKVCVKRILVPTRWSSLESLDYIRKRQECKIRTHWRRNKLTVEYRFYVGKGLGIHELVISHVKVGASLIKRFFFLACEEDCRAVVSLFGVCVWVCVCVGCVSE